MNFFATLKNSSAASLNMPAGPIIRKVDFFDMSQKPSCLKIIPKLWFLLSVYRITRQIK